MSLKVGKSGKSGKREVRRWELGHFGKVTLTLTACNLKLVEFPGARSKLAARSSKLSKGSLV
jgi:hypothetical protein